MLIHNAEVTGSLRINNVPFNSGSFSGSFRGDGSQLSGVTGATTASYVEYSNVGNKPALVSSSAQIVGYNIFATTGSNRFNGNQIVTGSFTVTTGSVVELQVTNTGVNIGNITTDNHNVTGSLKVSGSLTVTTTGTELQVTSTGVNLGNISTDVHNVTGSLRVSGSNSFNGSQVVTGSLTVTGQVIAQTLNVQQVTSSIVFSSGSNIFGNSLSNTQQFTGSVSVTGSLTVNGAGTFASSVTAGNNLLINNLAASKKGYTYQSPASNWGPQVSGLYFTPNNATDAKTTFTLELWNGAGSTITPLTITDTGAATFSSSVTAASYVSNATSGILFDNTSGGANATQIRLQNTGGNMRVGVESSTGGTIQVGTSAYAAVFGNQANAATQFTTNGTLRMTITSDGNVGIGTTPDSKFEIRGSTSTPQFRISRSEQTNQGMTILAGGGNTTFNSYDGTDTVFGSYTFNSTKGGTTAQRVFITTDATSTVEIVGATANNDNYPRLRFKGGTYPDADSKYPYIQLGNGGLALNINGGTSTTFNNPTQIALNNGTIFFSTAAASTLVSRMEIDSFGYVTTDPTSATNGGLITKGIEYSIKTVGSLTGYTQGAIVVSSGTDSVPSARGQGIFYFNEGNDITWYNGGLYNATDRWDICRKTGTSAIDASTAQTTHSLFNLNSSGAAYNATGTWGTISSDQRLKENIVDATSKLNDVLSLQVRNFNYIGKEEKYIGFIAQELEQVFPSLVTTNDMREFDRDGNVVGGLEDTKGVKVGMDFAILVKAIQELSAKVETLEDEIQTLKQQ